MPVYEYKCRECDEEFEQLMILGATAVECPKCGSLEVSKKISTFSFSCCVSCNRCQVKGE